eukprot:UN28418
MRDGGRCRLSWLEQKDKKAPILFVFTTLSGDECFPTANYMCQHFHKQGWRTCTFTKRGCGLNNPNYLGSAKIWSLGLYKDSVYVLKQIKKKFPDALIYGTGFSTGGIQLQKYMAEAGEDSLIEGGVSYDAGMDWYQCATSLDRRLPFVANSLAMAIKYNLPQFLTKTGKKKYYKVGRQKINVKSVNECGLIYDVLQHWNAPSNGFRPKDMSKYLAKEAHDMNDIKKPI